MTEIERELRTAMRAHEHLAPTTEEVLADLRRSRADDTLAGGRGSGPAGEQRRRRGAVLTLVSAAAAVFALIVGVSWLATDEGGEGGTGPADVSVEPPPGAAVVIVYFLEPGFTSIAFEKVVATSTGDPGYDAVNALLTHRSALDPPLDNGFNMMTEDEQPLTELNSVEEKGGVITVDVTSSMWDPLPNLDCKCPGGRHGETVMQQLVWTVQTALESDAPVLLTVDGRPARGIWGFPLDGPVPADPAVLSDRASLTCPPAEARLELGSQAVALRPQGEPMETLQVPTGGVATLLAPETSWTCQVHLGVGLSQRLPGALRHPAGTDEIRAVREGVAIVSVTASMCRRGEDLRTCLADVEKIGRVRVEVVAPR